MSRLLQFNLLAYTEDFFIFFLSILRNKIALFRDVDLGNSKGRERKEASPEERLWADTSQIPISTTPPHHPCKEETFCVVVFVLCSSPVTSLVSSSRKCWTSLLDGEWLLSHWPSFFCPCTFYKVSAFPAAAAALAPGLTLRAAVSAEGLKLQTDF